MCGTVTQPKTRRNEITLKYCMCLCQVLTKNRSGSLDLSLSEERLFLLGAKETQGSFENIRCRNDFKQNRVVKE